MVDSVQPDGSFSGQLETGDTSMSTSPQPTFQMQMLPVEHLELDLTNPRIAQWVEMYGNQITPEQMKLALGAGDTQADDTGATFYSLRESIKTNGGVIHPVIVNRLSNGDYVVIEGNTRVLIYREFSQQNVPGNWSTIPSMVYEGLSESEIDAIRLQAHLVGPRSWDPYSKARYLDRLRNSQHLTMAQIVDFCGGRRKEVLDYIAAFQDMELYYRGSLESDEGFDPSRFSAFVELQQARIQQALLRARFSKADFAGWVNDRLISPLHTVRQLPRILDNPRSREVFLRDGAQEALKVLDVPPADEAITNATLVQLSRELCRKILNISYSELQRLRADIAGEDSGVLCDARDQLTQLCTDIASNEQG